MDIDRAYTEEDKNKWRAQGRCFHCDRQGHMARECPSKKTQQQPFKSFQKNYPPKQGFRKPFKSFNQPQQQGFRKRNRFPNKQRQFQARAAYIEEVDPNQNYQYYQEQPDDMENEENNPAELAARAINLPDEEKQKFLAEMKQLDIHF